jgi:putative ABC transport system ATP-binding protein
MSSEIVANDLIKVYKTRGGEVQALRGLSVRVSHAQIVSIIGPSGSGKTTLLNILGGLDTPTAGRVRIGGRELTGLKSTQLITFRRQNIGHILQTSNLLPYLTAEENIELPMLAAGTSQSKRKARVSELLKVLEMSPRARHKPDELSGGERQRIAIASAIATNPPILLADEPTGELDTVNARAVVNLLSQLSREFGKTVVLVTHDPNVAQESDSILLIEDGRIKSTATPPQLFSETSPYIEGLRIRVAEIEKQLVELDSTFRNNEMDPSKYAESRLKLEELRTNLRDELHRLGIVN